MTVFPPRCAKRVGVFKEEFFALLELVVKLLLSVPGVFFFIITAASESGLEFRKLYQFNSGYLVVIEKVQKVGALQKCSLLEIPFSYMKRLKCL